MLENKGFCDTTKGKPFTIAVPSRKGRWEKLSGIAGYKPEFFLNFSGWLGSDTREVRAYLEPELFHWFPCIKHHPPQLKL